MNFGSFEFGLLGSTSLASTPAPGAPSFTSQPSITGTLADGALMTFNPGVASGGVIDQIEFMRDSGTVETYPYSGATITRATAAASDYGRFLRIRVRATGPGGVTYATSLARIAISDTNISAPLVTGPTNLNGFDGWQSVTGMTGAPTSDANLKVVNGAIREDANSGTSGARMWVKDSGSVNHGLELTMATSGSGGDTNRGIFIGVANSNNRILATVQDTTWVVVERENSTDKTLQSTVSGSNPPGTRFELIKAKAAGVTKIFMLRNGALVGTVGGNPSNVNLDVNTKVGVACWSPVSITLPATHSSNLKVKRYPTNGVMVAVSGTQRSPDNSALQRINFAPIFFGSATTLEVAVVDGAGNVVSDWAAATTWVDVPLLTAQNVTVYARSPGTEGAAFSVTVGLQTLRTIVPLKLGMNAPYITQWAGSNELANLADHAIWQTPAGKDILPRNVPALDGATPTSADGLGGTVQQDMDGKIYGNNSAGLTHYRLVLPAWVWTAGTYRIDFGTNASVTKVAGPGDNFTALGGGVYTIDFTGTPSGVNGTSLQVACSSIMAGTKPTVIRVGEAGAMLSTLGASNYAAIATSLRDMTPRCINNYALPALGTDTEFPVMTMAHYWSGAVRGYASGGNPHPSGAMDISKQVARANQIGADALYLNLWHIMGEDVADYEAGYIVSHLNPGVDVILEFSNEWLFSSGFASQFHGVRIAGLRRGYADASKMTHAAAVPITVIDGTRYVSRTSMVTSRAFNADDLIYVDQDGIGYMLWRANSNISAGATLSTSTNCTLVYSTAQTAVAAVRYVTQRTRELKARYDAILTAAGRPPSKAALMGQSAGTFEDVKPGLDFNDNWQIYVGGYEGAAPYWGGNMGSFTDNSVAGWGNAEKLLVYTDMAAAKTAFFAAAVAQVNVVIARAKTRADAMAQYFFDRMGDYNACTPSQYETGWHDTYSGWPCQASPYNGANPINTVGTFIYGGDGITYRTKAVVPAGTAPPNATYYDVYWDKPTSDARRTNVRPIVQFFKETRLDSRMGDRTSQLIRGFDREVGGRAYYFDGSGAPVDVSYAVSGINSGVGLVQSWAMLWGENDNDISGGPNTNWRYRALARFKAGLPHT